MWRDIGDLSQLVLGIAIAVYTIYEFATRHFGRRRQQYMLQRTLDGELSYFLALAHSLAHRSEQTVEAMPAADESAGFPNPAKEEDSLPDSFVARSHWLVDRAERLAAYRFSIDVEQIGTMLNRSQIAALSDFVDSHRRYVEILMTRALDLKAFPRKRGVLRRFASVVLLNVEGLEQALARLTRLLSPALKPAESGEAPATQA